MDERSALMIHHEGYGSCQTGLSTKTPAVIIPSFSERESNARRIAAVDVGLVVPVERGLRGKHVSADRLRAAVQQVHTYPSFPSFVANARRMGERLRCNGGAAYAAQLIERFSQAAKVSSPGSWSAAPDVIRA